MNSKTAKQLRRHAGVRSQPVQYEPRGLVPGSPRHEYHELKKCARLPC